MTHSRYGMDLKGVLQNSPSKDKIIKIILFTDSTPVSNAVFLFSNPLGHINEDNMKAHFISTETKTHKIFNTQMSF